MVVERAEGGVLSENSPMDLARKVCVDCDLDLPLQRAALGFDYCVTCAEERQRISRIIPPSKNSPIAKPRAINYEAEALRVRLRIQHEEDAKRLDLKKKKKKRRRKNRRKKKLVRSR